jgi:uncharacterized protein YndB with AHSA1/START domain
MTEQRYDLAALPERVWAALTVQDRLAAWFMPNDLVPVAGQAFTLSPGLPGLPSMIAGEVLEVAAGQRLRMRWDVGGEPVLVTWQVDPAPGGSALGVIREPALADPVTEAAFEAALIHRYANLLRSFLRGGMHVLPGTPAAEVPALPAWVVSEVSVSDLAVLDRLAQSDSSASVPMSAAPDQPSFIPVASAWSVASASPASVGSGSPDMPASSAPSSLGRRSRRLLVVSALIVVLLAGGWWALGTPGFSGSRTPDVVGAGAGTGGSGQVPAGPSGTAPGTAGGVGPSHSATFGGPDQSPHPPGGTATTTTPGSPGLPALVVHDVVGAETALSYHVTVTVSNPASAAQTWHNVWLRLTGVSVAVAVVSGPVSYSGGGCVVPTAGSSSVGADAAVTFVLAVTAVLPSQLGSVSAVALADPHCGR